MNKKIGIFPGTFDPITYGHFDIAMRALNIVDELIIGIATSNRKNPIFSPEERKSMVENEISKITNKSHLNRISVEIFDGLLINFMKEKNIKINIRGLRASSDFAYEFQMHCVNHKLDNTIETIFLTSLEKSQFISSSFVKEVVTLGGSVQNFVSSEIEEALKKRLLN
jgi:pantetheine-phosphate adenylyltransferase